jgi:hypothetical protein
MTEILYITDAGVQAANNAGSAGILIDVASFKLGSSNQAHADTDTNIHGTTIYQGTIHFVETLSNSSTRFTFDVPDYVGTEQGTPIHEVGVFLTTGQLFGRAVLPSPYLKKLGEKVRINAILNTNRCDLSNINVTVGDFSSVPSCPYVRRLPDPDMSDFNLLTVLDLRHNADTTVSPGVAMRYGPAGKQWAFMGYERSATFNPDSTNLNTSQFQKSGLASAAGIQDQDIVIVQIIAGPGSPEVRKFRYSNSTARFNELDGSPFSSLTTSSTLALWTDLEGSTGSTGQILPPLTNIPDDWVLTKISNTPVWAPQRNKACSLNSLYSEPSTLRISNIVISGDDRTSVFSLGGLTPESANYVYASVGGISQHRTAFDLVPYNIEFSEPIPSGASLDLQIFTKEASLGKTCILHVSSFTGNGLNLRYVLPKPIESAEYVWPFIAGFKQAITAFSVDLNTNELVFTEVPGPGIAIEVVQFVRADEEGYSTKIFSTKTLTQVPTYFLELPVAPQNKEQVLISMNGIHVHNNLFSLSGNIISLAGPIAKDRDVETIVFHNERAIGSPQTNLNGVVTDAVLTSKTLSLFRHGSIPIKLPIPGISLEAGPGIRVSGTHPNYKVESTVAEFVQASPMFKFSTLHVLENAEEIVYTHRIDLNSDLIVQVIADFSAILGPGFASTDGLEQMEYVIGFRTTSAKEPDYGRKIKGTGTAGFSALLTSGVNNRAYSNASLTQTFDIVLNNIPAKFLDIVAKMRVKNAAVNIYGSDLRIDLNVLCLPQM